MANSQTYSNKNDRLSNLPDELLITILSFLPTHIAARTSVLSRRFRPLWKVSPSLSLISRDLPQPQRENFAAMAKCAILRRSPSHPIISLHLEVYRCHENASFLSSLMFKVHSLNLHHLTIKGCGFRNFLLIIPMIFTIKSLRCLSLDCFLDSAICFPSGTSLTCLRSLSLGLIWTDPAKLNQLLSELCSLEDLHLNISDTLRLNISSQTIRKLKLIIASGAPKLNRLDLSLPKLESLHLKIEESLENLSLLHGEVPLLRKAVISLQRIYEKNVCDLAGLLNCMSHVQELTLHLKESENVKYPIPILLESGKDVPNFSNLKHLDVTLCFHEHNLEAITTLLYNCPVLKSLKLVHEIPEFTHTESARARKKKDWESKLPINADGNYHYAYFKNLHLEENRKEVIKLLRKNCSSKRQAK